MSPPPVRQGDRRRTRRPRRGTTADLAPAALTTVDLTPAGLTPADPTTADLPSIPYEGDPFHAR